jgi:hypothetical protein
MLDAKGSDHVESIVHKQDHPDDGNTSNASMRQPSQVNLEFPRLEQVHFSPAGD